MNMNKQTIVTARGVLKSGGGVLCCYNKAQDFFFLPGGKIEKEEDAIICLQREFKEECQLEVRVGSFLGCLECHWQEKQQYYQEFSMIFAVDLPSKKIPAQVVAIEPHISFHFLPYAQVVNKERAKMLPHKVAEFLGDTLQPAKYTIEKQA